MQSFFNSRSQCDSRSRCGQPQWIATCAVFMAALLALCAAPGVAQSLLGEEYVETKSTTIGSNGELFHIQAGMHLDLFPEDPSAGWNTVLALDVVRDGELAERIVLPGTEGFEIESDASVLADGEQLFVLWTSRAEDDLSTLELISFDAETSSFGSVVDVTGDPLPLGQPPQLAVTRESLALPAEFDEEGEETAPAVNTTRTVVHVLWSQEDVDGGASATFYSPVVLTDGEYLGWNPIEQLDAQFFGFDDSTSSSNVSPDLLRSAALDRGADERSVVIALPDADSGELLNMVVRLLPEGLLALAEEARSHIVGVGLILTGEGTGGPGPGDYLDVAENARSHIVGVGRVNMHRGVRDFIGMRVAERILAEGEAAGANGLDADELAAAVWSEAMDAGASLLGNQLRSEDLLCGTLHLGESGVAAAGLESTESRHQVEICLSSEHSLPETTSELGAEHRIVTSEDGSRSLVAWQDTDGTVSYRRTVLSQSREGPEAESWTEAVVLPEAGLTLEAAVALLRGQVRVR